MKQYSVTLGGETVAVVAGDESEAIVEARLALGVPESATLKHMEVVQIAADPEVDISGILEQGKAAGSQPEEPAEPDQQAPKAQEAPQPEEPQSPVNGEPEAPAAADSPPSPEGV